VTPFEDEVIGSKYLVRKGNTATVQIAFLHRDPLVYGEDAESFKPERMWDGKFEALPVSNFLVNMHRADRNPGESMVTLWKRRSSMYCKQFLGYDQHP
jgi:cytochrome P450